MIRYGYVIFILRGTQYERLKSHGYLCCLAAAALPWLLLCDVCLVDVTDLRRDDFSQATTGPHACFCTNQCHAMSVCPVSSPSERAGAQHTSRQAATYQCRQAKTDALCFLQPVILQHA